MSHATEDAKAHGKTIGALLDAGLLEAADVVRHIGAAENRNDAVARLVELDGVGKTGANQIFTWLRNLGWPDAFTAETEPEAVTEAQDAPADPPPGEHPHVTAWLNELAVLFPSTSVETYFDIGQAVFDAYASGRIPALRIDLRSSHEEPRDYLGASSLGAECSRRAWAKYRRIHEDEVDGRKLRLFRSGDVYEERMRAELRAIGFQTRGSAGFEAKGGRVKGHNDDFLTIASLPLALWEAKSGNRSQVRKLQKLLADQLGPDAKTPLTPQQCAAALKQWSPKYYYQAQVYMGAWDIHVCLYEVSCKDTDSIVAFLVPRDDDAIREAGKRADIILDPVGVPPRGFPKSKTPECTNFCDGIEWCWYGADMPRVCGSCTNWRDGRCALTDNPAIAVCDEYVALSADESTATEWEAL